MAEQFTYLTEADFRGYSLGVDLSGFPEGGKDIRGILQAASVAASRFCQRSFQYRSVAGEMHDWPVGTGFDEPRWIWYPIHNPVRVLTSAEIRMTVNLGEYTTFDLDVVNVGPPDTWGLPTAFGHTYLDRQRGYLQTDNYLLRYGLFSAFPSLAMRPPQIAISYTAGYDDGTIQDDGFSITYPPELVEGVRIIAATKADAWTHNRDGMMGVNSASDGDVSISYARTRNTRGYINDIPEEAMGYLKDLRQVSLYGNSGLA